MQAFSIYAFALNQSLFGPKNEYFVAVFMLIDIWIKYLR